LNVTLTTLPTFGAERTAWSGPDQALR
jgi:hypothetical protein